MIYKRSFYILSTVVLVSALILISSGYSVCPDGKTFTKNFSGDVASITGNITMVGLTTAYFNAPLPASHNCTLSLPNDTALVISWTDWRGSQNEYVPCTSVGYLVNNIPFPPPKSGQTAKT